MTNTNLTAAAMYKSQIAQPGDKQFFELYDKHHNQVRKILGRLVKPNDLDDAVQETFIKVFKNYHTFNHKSKESTWIYRIAINTARDHQRKEFRFKRLIEEWLNKSPKDSYKNDVSKKIQLEYALESLKFNDRTIAVLYFSEGHTLSEISEIFNIPVGTVKSRIHSIRKQLQSHLKEDETHE